MPRDGAHPSVCVAWHGLLRLRGGATAQNGGSDDGCGQPDQLAWRAATSRKQG
ncbi:MAG TPA: hypothetical protein VGD57_00525 [Candidatus Dormibacteraeota bacterium]